MAHKGAYIIYVSHVYERLGPYVTGEEDGVAREEDEGRAGRNAAASRR